MQSSSALSYRTPKHATLATLELWKDLRNQSDGIAVRSEFQNKGLVRTAITQVLCDNPRATRVDLAMHPNNLAVKLYESLGFKLETSVENYYGDGELRLILALTRPQR